ncbi:MAG TPA: cupredoxin domain-containing protein [Anaerolineales bacterium]|nr:cupredoxin domain-containing protein [Anaerolineales bacterium]
MKRRIFFPLLIAFGLFFVACSRKPPEPVSFTIEMSEYAFEPDTIEVKVGQEVTLELVNMGQLPHELMFGRQVMMMENRPNGYQVDMFASAGVEPEVMMMEGEAHGEEEEGHAGFMVLLEKSGDKATMTFTVTDDMVGEWEMGCFEQEGVHYEAGMVGKLVVTP